MSSSSTIRRPSRGAKNGINQCSQEGQGDCKDIILPYVEGNRNHINKPDCPGLVIMDNFKG